MNGHAVFSYRVSGVLIRDGKILLQHPIGSPDYAFPGGHVCCGETQLPLDGSFRVKDEQDEGLCDLEFCWIRLSTLKDIELYPTNLKEKLMDLSDGIEHFVFTEGQ
ncbi:MAG: hypothetical protein PHH46_10595 [Firmicutes bacterium]|jgi:hypothetical protein|nr:hypothetical protein [Bacillota bacterium]